jgi:FixJ family two-component response regulator
MPVGGICVAVVDDDASVRRALGRLLRLADYDVVAFASGNDFLASLGSRRPDCVVLDVNMPGLSGIEVQSQLRATRMNVPAVFITASNDPAVMQTVVESGAIRLLRKPFCNEELLEAVSTALQH